MAGASRFLIGLSPTCARRGERLDVHRLRVLRSTGDTGARPHSAPSLPQAGLARPSLPYSANPRIGPPEASTGSCGSGEVWNNSTHGGYRRHTASQAEALLTASIMQTRRRGGRVGPSWSAGSSTVATVLLMAALFLAHGLQCAVASDHGPVAMSHTLVAPFAAEDVLHDGATRHGSELSMLVSALAHPVATVGGRDGPGRAGVVCVAVLTAIGLWFLSVRKAVLSSRGQGASSCPAGDPTARLSAAARWRPPALDLAVLCVLRT